MPNFNDDIGPKHEAIPAKLFYPLANNHDANGWEVPVIKEDQAAQQEAIFRLEMEARIRAIVEGKIIERPEIS